MFEWLPIPLQVYLFSLLLGAALPVGLFWMLEPVLKHFLAAIFASEPIERFWLRLALLVLVLAALAAALRYRADASVLQDAVAIVFSVADAVQAILEALLYALFALFLPLLLSYTILHAGRRRT